MLPALWYLFNMLLFSCDATYVFVLFLLFRSVGLPKAQSFCAFNPSRDTNIEVDSMFTSGRNFHVSPIHSRVSVDVLLETMSWMMAKTSSFPWHNDPTLQPLARPFSQHAFTQFSSKKWLVFFSDRLNKFWLFECKWNKQILSSFCICFVL